ncbi:MarR family winged helix-turn-helix transcriptional regulator [Asanoa siamensis]|uniref:DNA-binding MarR family transcriptional regulator n=1 Tax=Asanoa siamensis TaxID=926357 RepID=A0ABQ4CSU7_9ACTN|nr:hypothetical protein [Asanoa siamensis]GIF74355.1 hypothetical protein Asi02nite_38730 [Asanoa siamensis]
MTDFNAQLIGRTEKALNAILDRELAAIGITEPQWVALTLTVTGGSTGAEVLVGRIAQALRVDAATARQRLDELEAAGLTRITDGVAAATDQGTASWHQVRNAVAPITRTLWGDLPPADLATAGRVLTTVLARADTMLSAR